MSVTAALNVTVAAQVPTGAFTEMLAGQVISGASLSVTVTVKLQLEVLPAISDTVKALVVVPIGNTDPLGNPLVCVIVTPGVNDQLHH